MVESLIKGKLLNKFEKICSISLYTLPLTSFGMNKNIVNNVANNGVNNVNEAADILEYKSIIKRINDKYFSKRKCKFEFENFISKGGYGRVVCVKVINKITGKISDKRCALKITENSNLDKNEENLFRKFKRNGIVNFIESFTISKNNNTDKKLLIFALEYCKFGDLNNFKNKFLKRTSLSETLVCYIAGQIVNVLASLHSCKYVYLDLKPNNILVNDKIEFLLSDFSTCLKYSKDFYNYPYGGTENYMAPEIIRRSKIINRKDFFKPDVYSLGGMLYRLYTGNFHYEKKGNNFLNNKGEIDIQTSIIKNDVNLDNLVEVSDVFKDFLLKCLEKNVTKRPTIFDLKEHPFINNLYKILKDEEENFYDTIPFLTYLMTNYFKSYNDECGKYEIKNGILTLKKTNIEVNNNEIISIENKENKEEVNEINEEESAEDVEKEDDKEDKNIKKDDSSKLLDINKNIIKINISNEDEDVKNNKGKIIKSIGNIANNNSLKKTNKEKKGNIIKSFDDMVNDDTWKINKYDNKKIQKSIDGNGNSLKKTNKNNKGNIIKSFDDMVNDDSWKTNKDDNKKIQKSIDENGNSLKKTNKEKKGNIIKSFDDMVNDDSWKTNKNNKDKKFLNKKRK